MLCYVGSKPKQRWGGDLSQQYVEFVRAEKLLAQGLTVHVNKHA